MIIFGTLLGFFVGFSLGLLGGGGSVLTVPIFVYVLDLSVRQAVAGSLVVVGMSALVGAIRQHKDGNVEIRIALSFGVLAMIGSFGGAKLATLLPETLQLVLFAVVMFVAAILMLRGRPEVPDALPVAVSWAKITPAALGVGVLTGVVGVGGGFMIVPALVFLLGLPMKKAIGTSLLVIAMNAVSGSAGYFGHVEVPWGLLLGFGGLSIVGVFVGSKLMKKASPAALKKGFAIFLIVIAIAILIQNALQI